MTEKIKIFRPSSRVLFRKIFTRPTKKAMAAPKPTKAIRHNSINISIHCNTDHTGPKPNHKGNDTANHDLDSQFPIVFKKKHHKTYAEKQHAAQQ